MYIHIGIHLYTKSGLQIEILCLVLLCTCTVGWFPLFSCDMQHILYLTPLNKYILPSSDEVSSIKARLKLCCNKLPLCSQLMTIL